MSDITLSAFFLLIFSAAIDFVFFQTSWLLDEQYEASVRLFAICSLWRESMPLRIGSLLQTPLKRTAGRSTVWCPVTSLPYMIYFVIRLPFIRCMWPSHRRQRWQRWRFMQSAWSSIRAFVMLSLHVIPCISRAQRIQKLSSCVFFILTDACCPRTKD